MGNTIGTDQVVCRDDGFCTFFPEPDQLADFAGQAASGTWRFCVSDSAGADTRAIARVSADATFN